MTFQQENDKFLKFLLNERFFKVWRSPDYSDKSLWAATQLELFLTNQCNQNCSYCYLYDNDNLYPKIAASSEKVLENLQLICRWIYENEYDIPNVALFSGEIWHMNFGWKVLGILQYWLEQGMKVRNFTLPTNGSFLLDKNVAQVIQNYCNNFLALGSHLDISFSIDGKIVDNLIRPRKSQNTYTDEFYDAIFTFAYHNDATFHPMVAASTVKYWKENFQWWKQKCEEYNMNVYHEVMMLEVRNDDWTEANIKDYVDFLEFLLDDFYQHSSYNSDEAFTRLLCGGSIHNEKFSYLPFLLTPADDTFSCTLPIQLCLRVGDLSVAPCHRLAYEHLLYGTLKTDEKHEHIIDLIENNAYMAQRCLYVNNSAATPGCDNCAYNQLCLHGCGGAQYEATGDPFFPIKSVCMLEKAKINALIDYYQIKGIISKLENIPIEDINYHSAYNILEPIYAIKKLREKEKKNL